MTRRAFAQEDINLGTNSVEISRTRKYVDIDLTLAVKPTSGDIYKKNDAAAVKQAVKNLIMTNRLEKPFRPNFGGDIRSALFELADYGENFILTEQITSTIQRNEPRAKVMKIITTTTDDYKNSVDVTIIFRIRNTSELVQLTTNLVRLR